MAGTGSSVSVVTRQEVVHMAWFLGQRPTSWNQVASRALNEAIFQLFTTTSAPRDVLFHMQRNKNTFHSCKKKHSERSKNSNKTSRSRGSIHRRSIHIQWVRSSSCILSFYFIFCLFFSNHRVSYTTFCRFHSQQSNRERKKSTVIDLKAFSHYVMKVHTKNKQKNIIINFYSSGSNGI